MFAGDCQYERGRLTGANCCWRSWASA